MTTVNHEEGRLVGGGRVFVVIGELRPREEVDPIVLTGGNEVAKVVAQDLIDPLYLSVGLGVV